MYWLLLCCRKHLVRTSEGPCCFKLQEFGHDADGAQHQPSATAAVGRERQTVAPGEGPAKELMEKTIASSASVGESNSIGWQVSESISRRVVFLTLLVIVVTPPLTYFEPALQEEFGLDTLEWIWQREQDALAAANGGTAGMLLLPHNISYWAATLQALQRRTLYEGGDIVQMELSYPEIAAAASQVMRPQAKPTFVSGNWSPVQNGTQSLILTGLLIVRVWV